MPGAGYSGKDGTVKIGSTDVAEIRNWKFNPKSNNPKYASNKTSGYKRTVAGVKEASGSMSGAWDHAIDFLAVVDVGTSVTLKLYTDLTHFFSVPAVIDDCSINVDVDSGEIVSWDSNFSANGAWTNPASPMMAPENFVPSSGDGSGGGAPPIEQKSNVFTQEQMAQIATISAQAAATAMEAFFARLNPTTVAGGANSGAVLAEPGGADPVSQ